MKKVVFDRVWLVAILLLLVTHWSLLNEIIRSFLISFKDISFSFHNYSSQERLTLTLAIFILTAGLARLLINRKTGR